MDSEAKKKNIIDLFIEGCRKGWNTGISNMLPNVIMAFIIIKALNVTGLLKLLGTVFAPVMAVWGLPGEAVTVLASAFMSMGGGIGAAAGLLSSNALNGRDRYYGSDARHLPDGFHGAISGALLGHCRS